MTTHLKSSWKFSKRFIKLRNCLHPYTYVYNAKNEKKAKVWKHFRMKKNIIENNENLNL